MVDSARLLGDLQVADGALEARVGSSVRRELGLLYRLLGGAVQHDAGVGAVEARSRVVTLLRHDGGVLHGVHAEHRHIGLGLGLLARARDRLRLGDDSHALDAVHLGVVHLHLHRQGREVGRYLEALLERVLEERLALGRHVANLLGERRGLGLGVLVACLHVRREDELDVDVRGDQRHREDGRELRRDLERVDHIDRAAREVGQDTELLEARLAAADRDDRDRDAARLGVQADGLVEALGRRLGLAVAVEAADADVREAVGADDDLGAGRLGRDGDRHQQAGPERRGAALLERKDLARERLLGDTDRTLQHVGLAGLEQLVVRVQLVAGNHLLVLLAVADHRHLVVERHEADRVVGLLLRERLDLRRDGGLHRLQTRHVRHVAALARKELVRVVVDERVVGRLGVAAQSDLARNLGRHAHGARDVDTEHHRRLLLGVLGLGRHLANVVDDRLLGYLLLGQERRVDLVAEGAAPVQAIRVVGRLGRLGRLGRRRSLARARARAAARRRGAARGTIGRERRQRGRQLVDRAQARAALAKDRVARGHADVLAEEAELDGEHVGIEVADLLGDLARGSDLGSALLLEGIEERVVGRRARRRQRRRRWQSVGGSRWRCWWWCGSRLAGLLGHAVLVCHGVQVAGEVFLVYKDRRTEYERGGTDVMAPTRTNEREREREREAHVPYSTSISLEAASGATYAHLEPKRSIVRVLVCE